MPINHTTYQPGGTPIHAVDARVKITLAFVYSIAIFFVDSWWGMGAYAVCIAACFAIARIRVLSLVRQLIPLWVILAFTVLSNALSGAGLFTGLFYVSRIVLILGASLILTVTSTASELSQALESMLRPLAILRLPVRDIAAVTSIALRFIPIIIDEFQLIEAAQASRGARFASGGLLVRVRAWGGAFTPLFVGLYRRADRLAASMTSRCYGATRVPTRLHERRLGAGSAVAMACAAVALCCCAAVL